MAIEKKFAPLALALEAAERVVGGGGKKGAETGPFSRFDGTVGRGSLACRRVEGRATTITLPISASLTC
jgi:hypothetical protein